MVLLFPTAVSCQGEEHGSMQGFLVSNEAYDKERLEELRDSIRAGVYKRLNSVVVIQNGALLIEEYFNGTRREQTHDVRSVGKTFASAVMGIAIEDGYIQSVDQPLSDFYDLKRYDNYHPSKERITLRHLLTMSSHFDGNDSDYDSPGNEGNMYPQDNWVEWTLNLPVDTTRKSGAEWNYFTAGIILLGDILEKSVPGGLEAYADEKLFQPIAVDRYYWTYTPQRVPNTAGGIRLTPLGFARFGHVYLEQGKWKGRPILSEEWVSASLSPVLSTTIEPNDYGYLWWIKDYEVEGKKYRTQYCSGNGGNKIFVLPSLDAVVVITASAYGRPYMHEQVDAIMTRYILPAIAD